LFGQYLGVAAFGYQMLSLVAVTIGFSMMPLP
jgi:hypothetical protein